jgi:hypothetical protein
MRAGWAIIGGIGLAAAAYWFTLSPDQRPNLRAWFGPASEPGQATPVPAPQPDQVTRVYRWIDDSGVVNLSDQPPTDRSYEPVDIRSDRNIVPFADPTPEPEAPPGD